MGARMRRFSAFVLSLSLATSFAIVAGADEKPTVAIWYRTSAECPDASTFIGLLAARHVSAKIARAGDPIDFVVTLGPGEHGATGLLERQSAERTALVRQVDDAKCADVANALALGLALAAEGRAETPAENAPPQTPKVAENEPIPAREKTPAVGVVEPPHDANPTRDTPPPSSTRPDERRTHTWRIGLSGTVTTGIAPNALPGAMLSIDAGHLTTFGTSARLSAAGASTSSTFDDQSFRTSFAFGRIEGCPAAIGDAVRITACAGWDLGAVFASGSGPKPRSDAAWWSAIVLLGRATFRVAGPVAVDVQAGEFVPLTRYDVGDVGGKAPYRMASLGFQGAAGISVALP
jgi:hypothetical protein